VSYKVINLCIIELLYLYRVGGGFTEASCELETGWVRALPQTGLLAGMQQLPKIKHCRHLLILILFQTFLSSVEHKRKMSQCFCFFEVTSCAILNPSDLCGQKMLKMSK